MECRRLALVALAALGCGAVACGGDAPASPPGRIPGVVLLCIDTLRADAARAPDGGPGRLLSLEAFAKDAATFADATAPASWTEPSVASLLTGLQPSRHGVDLGFSESANRRLAPSLTTLAGALQARGWFASAFTGGGWVTPAQGLGRGFDHFSPNFDLKDPAATLTEWQARRPKDRPFFLFLHTFVAHDPYGDKDVFYEGRCTEREEASRVAAEVADSLDRGVEPPAALYADAIRVRWTDACGRAVLERRLGPQRMRALSARTSAWTQGGWREDPAAGDRLASHLRAAYESGLGTVDRKLARVFEGLRRCDLPRGTMVVVVGDHGEAFGEGGQLYHGQSLHDALIRVPLLVSLPGRLSGGTVVRGGCGLVDVFPTVLDAAGIPVPEGLDGRSLVPLAGGAAVGRPMVAEGRRDATADRPACGLLCVRVPEAKWLLEYDPVTGSVVSEALYDLRADPGERTPLSPSLAPGYGAPFCLAVSRARNDLRARFGLAATPPLCSLVR